jgi:L-Ala-D/L-Glu epimerase
MFYNSLKIINMLKGHKLKLEYAPFLLKLRHPFHVAWGSRETTPVVLVSLTCDGVTGYGEASMPPYLGESPDSVTGFLSKVDFRKVSDVSDIDSLTEYLDSIAPGNYAAKASVDIAVHDLIGRIEGQPCHIMWGYDPQSTPYTSFTIGIDSPGIIRLRVQEADEYKILKIKLGDGNDREIMRAVRDLTDKPLYVDVNQGWKDRQYALDMIYWLKEIGVSLVEQPMPDSMESDIEWLIQRSPLPVFADEGIKRVEDMERRKGLYNGVNIKLMKCGGLNNARKMIEIARKAGMKVMIGCMTETSCAVSAAAQLSPAADYADLDGNLLISNDIYDGMKIVDGKVLLPGTAGIGIVRKK